jgi:hypothetical protein
MKLRILRAACMAVLLTSATVAGAQMQHGGHTRQVVAENPWARASVGKSGIAFVTLVNRGGSEDRLVAVRSDVAERATLHAHTMDGTIMRMRKVEAVPVPAGGTVTLKPGGLHVMMLGLKRKLAEGDEFAMTLVFEMAGEVTVKVPVMKAGAMGPGTSHGGMRH